MQPFPELSKQAVWSSDVVPDPVDWDAEIAHVVEKGKEVPEVDWVEPGEDAALEVLASIALPSYLSEPLWRSCGCRTFMEASLNALDRWLGECVLLHVREGHVLLLLQALLGSKGFLLKDRISVYSTKRNDPNQPEALSNLSPYFHFGQLAPQRAALEASKLRSKHRVRPGSTARHPRTAC
jgi:deoxyribodipyrimidine photo-lyase